MKAALEIWGSKSNLFQQGFAKETDDATIVNATMEHPGVVLRRPVGTQGAFKQNAELPKLEALRSAIARPPKSSLPKTKRVKKSASKKSDPATARAAAKLYDLEQKRRERDEQRAEARRVKEERHRAQGIEKAEAAFDNARALHEKRNSEIAKERDALDRREREEEERWRDQKESLEEALIRARRG
ncbi:MAG TPA: cell envelope biogenesis protein TolA [Rhizomicrobium sp.]|nr:cell envelope biogenesis protein TolA [Rhizomicrobium sp.]